MYAIIYIIYMIVYYSVDIMITSIIIALGETRELTDRAGRHAVRVVRRAPAAPFIYVYICIYIYMYTHIYIYIYIVDYNIVQYICYIISLYITSYHVVPNC